MERRRLKVFRVERGLTQAAMAHVMGVSRSGYVDVETGKAGASERFARKLQRAFGIPDEEIWGLLKPLEQDED